MSEPPEGDHAELVRSLTTARERTATQVDALARDLDQIFEASELVSTDDEHDPEGTTIAYERAQVTALLAQAREDLDCARPGTGRRRADRPCPLRGLRGADRGRATARAAHRAHLHPLRAALTRDREECRASDP